MKDYLQIRIPKELKDRLKAYAEKRSMSMGELIRYLVRREIDKNE